MPEGPIQGAHPVINLLPITPTGGFHLHCSINGHRTSFLLDTGAAVSLLRKEMWDQFSTGAPTPTLQPWSGDAYPIRQPVRRISPKQREEVCTLIQDMLKDGVIEKSTSPWASPIVLVRKKDGSTRFCVDYRRVNGVSRKDAYPLPRIDSTLDALAGSKWFSTLDLLSGYWQVEVSKEDHPKTAFCTTEGLYQFQVMPFGLCNAPATFQRLMDLVLSGLQ